MTKHDYRDIADNECHHDTHHNYEWRQAKNQSPTYYTTRGENKVSYNANQNRKKVYFILNPFIK